MTELQEARARLRDARQARHAAAALREQAALSLVAAERLEREINDYVTLCRADVQRLSDLERVWNT